MELDNLSFNELVYILKKRVKRLEGVLFEHPLDTENKMNNIDEIFNEIKSRFNEYKKEHNK